MGAKGFEHTSQPWPYLLPSCAPSWAPCLPVSEEGAVPGPQLNFLQHLIVLGLLLRTVSCCPSNHTNSAVRLASATGFREQVQGEGLASTMLVSPAVTLKPSPAPDHPPAAPHPAWNRALVCSAEEYGRLTP